MSLLARELCDQTLGHLPTARQVVKSRQTPRKVVRLLICRRYRHTKANALRYRSHGSHGGQWLVDGPLGTGNLCGIEGLRVDIVAASFVLADLPGSIS